MIFFALFCCCKDAAKLASKDCVISKIFLDIVFSDNITKTAARPHDFFEVLKRGMIEIGLYFLYCKKINGSLVTNGNHCFHHSECYTARGKLIRLGQTVMLRVIVCHKTFSRNTPFYNYLLVKMTSLKIFEWNYFVWWRKFVNKKKSVTF